MIALLNEQISRRQRELAQVARRVYIASYNVHLPFIDLFMLCRQTRVIIGCPEIQGERQATITSIAQAAATRYKSAEVRVLPGSHVKLFVAHLPKGLRAVVGSQNLGLGHPYELAVEIEGDEAENLLRIYDRLWRKSILIKPLELGGLVEKLSSSEFEA